MTSHDDIRKLLPLSAAGLLTAEEERIVRDHLRDCAGCAARAEDFAMLAGGLHALPAPPLPLGVIARTEARLAAEADRRQGAILAAAGTALGWITTVSSWYLYHRLSGGAWGWLVLLTLPASMAIPAAAAVVGRSRWSRRMS